MHLYIFLYVQVDEELSCKSESENELEDVCKIIADSHNKLDSVEKLANEFFADGLIKNENLREYVSNCTLLNATVQWIGG